jgi:TolB-like protein/DNA-binding SARP family transcriptional activator/Tfp pilus assembly protein PilF
LRAFHLRLFGPPALEADGVALDGRAAQRHRLALLALLALSPGQRLSRDKLIASLWPERDADGGRNLLKVSSYVLRSALGEDALLTAGDELRLNPDAVTTDVAAFEEAIATGDHARAAALYRAPLLDGFFLSDAPEFERWVDRERERLARACWTALEALAQQAEEAGDPAGAVEWWKRRAAQDPFDSRVALRLMQALETGGNVAGALQHASVHERLLQDEFGVAPAPEITAFAERLRREGKQRPATRPVDPAAMDPPDTASPAAEVAPPVAAGGSAALPSSSAPLRRWRGRWLAAAGVGAVLVIAAGLQLWPGDSATEPSIVVLPFANLSADSANEYFSDGLTEEIITRLAAVPGLKVISRTSAMHYKGSSKPLPQIAGELGVDHVLEGSVRASGGRLRIAAQLIDARDDHHLWADSYEDDPADAFRLQEEIARQVVDAMELRLGARARRLLARPGTRNAEALEFYRRARFAWNSRTREGHERATEYFERAIARDSNYADAYAGLADVHLTAFQLNLFDVPESEVYSRLKWAAERALALDDESADAHTAVAITLWWQQNWPGAAREFRRAIELNPNHATALSWYSLLLRGMGRFDEAMRTSRRARELDPFAVVVVYNNGWHCYHARDFACAEELYRSALEITDYPSAWRGLGLAYTHMGRAAEAQQAVERAIALAPHRTDFIADLAYVQARAGLAGDARATLHDAKREPWESFNVARAHIALGEPDSAFAWLERSNWRWPHRAARDDPALDPLRGDARFATLEEWVEREMGMR